MVKPEEMLLIAEFKWLGDVVTLLASEDVPIEEAHQVRYSGDFRNFPEVTYCKSLNEARDLFSRYTNELQNYTSSSDLSLYLQQRAEKYVA